MSHLQRNRASLQVNPAEAPCPPCAGHSYGLQKAGRYARYKTTNACQLPHFVLVCSPAVCFAQGFGAVGERTHFFCFSTLAYSQFCTYDLLWQDSRPSISLHSCHAKPSRREVQWCFLEERAMARLLGTLTVLSISAPLYASFHSYNREMAVETCPCNRAHSSGMIGCVMP